MQRVRSDRALPTRNFQFGTTNFQGEQVHVVMETRNKMNLANSGGAKEFSMLDQRNARGYWFTAGLAVVQWFNIERH